MSGRIGKRAGQALVFAGIVAMLVLASGCEKQNGVQITYGPILNAPTSSSSVVKKPITEIALVSCIYSIKNTGKDAEDFQFDLTYVKPQGGYQFYTGPEPEGLNALPKNILVKAGTEAKDLGMVVLKADVGGVSEDDMATEMAKLLYTNPQKPNIGVLFLQYPASPTPLWDPATVFKNVTLPACQGPK